MKVQRCIALLPFAALLAAGPASQPVAPRAARSVHLFYSAPKSVVYYNEETVRQSTKGSFFMCCGFAHGYFGMQDHGDHKNLIFSVWDSSKGDKPGAVLQDRRVEAVYTGDGVTIRRFGGEGTGGQCWMDYDWKIGQTYRYFLTSKVEQNKTEYAAWFFMPETNAWKHLATFRTITGGDELTSLHSFIEDFRRDTQSATETRRAEFGNGWAMDAEKHWHPLVKGRFTASGASLAEGGTVDAGVANDCFCLRNGGDANPTRDVNSGFERPVGGAKPPELPRE